jgi:hypothetical protein
MNAASSSNARSMRSMIEARFCSSDMTESAFDDTLTLGSD